MQTADKRDVRGNVIPPRSSHAYAPPVERTTEEEVVYMPPRRHHWLFPVGVTMGICAVLLLVWFQIVIPRWIRYQEQLSCGSQHICMTDAVVVPGQPARTFVSMIYNQRVTVIEVGKPDGTDSHIYIGGFVSLTNWQQVTPQIRAQDVNNDGYTDLVIVSPDFDNAYPVLYNQGNGSFAWIAPPRKEQ
jgi:hypothetical protein